MLREILEAQKWNTIDTKDLKDKRKAEIQDNDEDYGFQIVFYELEVLGKKYNSRPSDIWQYSHEDTARKDFKKLK